ncbi:MAG: tetratricopeptide repeat protein [Nitrospirota bacterium]
MAWAVTVSLPMVFGPVACEKKESAPSSEVPAPPAASGESAAPPDPQVAKAMEEIVQYRQRVAQNPNDVEALAALGTVNLMLQRPDHAKEWFERVLKVDPNRKDTRIDLAIALRYLQQSDEAIKQLNLVLAKDPKNAAALFNAGIILLEDKKDQPAAIAKWEALMKAYPDDPRVPQLRQMVEGLKHPTAAAPPTPAAPSGG